MSNSRKITVFSTKGKQKAHIDTDVATWGELKPLIENEGYDVSSLHATENINRTNLEHKDAVLPEKAFTLFLRPKKTKSGATDADIDAMSFKDLRAALTDSDKTAISEMFDKNYTRCSTDNLKEYLKSKGDSTEEVAEEAEVEEVAETVEETTEDAETPVTPLDKANQVKALLSEICEESDNEDICGRTEVMVEDAEGLIADLEAIYSPEAAAAKAKAEEEAAEAKRLDEEETERLKAEAKELKAGF